MIICNRRTLKLLSLSYYSNKPWTFAVEKYNDIFFLKELGKANNKERIGENEYFGYIFENQIFACPGEVCSYVIIPNKIINFRLFLKAESFRHMKRCMLLLQYNCLAL